MKAAAAAIHRSGAALRRTVALVAQPLRGRDLALHAAGVTFYAGIAIVPVSLLTLWLAGVIAGAERVRRLTGYVVAALPTAIGADRALATLVDAALSLTPVFALVALLPATLYGEGLRRAFVSLGAPAERLVGWRGRLAVLPLLATGPALLLVMLAALAVATRLVRQGGWAGVGGVVVSFLTAWILLWAVLIWIYREVAPGRPAWLATVIGASVTAANVSGFLHGFVLFASLPLDLGAPFGGLWSVGGMVAVGLWLYVFHVLVLVGYAFTREASRWQRARTTAAAPAAAVRAGSQTSAAR